MGSFKFLVECVMALVKARAHSSWLLPSLMNWVGVATASHSSLCKADIEIHCLGNQGTGGDAPSVFGKVLRIGPTFVSLNIPSGVDFLQGCKVNIGDKQVE